jgi:FAD/FMN-containing dehydrogenase
VTRPRAHRHLSPPTDFRGVFRTDADALGVYAEAAGIQRIWPSAVAVPVDPLDVVTLVQWAGRTGTALVPRGSGSSMAGGAVGAGVIVDLSGLRELGPVHSERRRMTVGPGALCSAVDAAAAHFGLRFPVDPSSAAFCTVGGMASTNAAGAHTLKYGSTRAWVTALDCIFADGSRALVRRGEPLSASSMRIPAIQRFLSDVAPRVTEDDETLRHAGVRKESSGYGLWQYAGSGELVDLLVGSEGTLAIFVGLELALAPRPDATASVLAAYDSFDVAVAGASIARDEGASACELLDRTFLDIAREDLARLDPARDASDAGRMTRALPPDCDAVLLIELEADDPANGRSRARDVERALLAAGAVQVIVALEPAAEETLWSLRHAASPVLARLDPSLKSMQFIEDGAVPPARLTEYVHGVRAALARHRCRAAIFGHAGDAHIHVNPLVDVGDPTWRARVEALLDDVTALVAELGGTLTGEHGDGRLRAPLLPAVWGGAGSAALRLFNDVKSTFDPEGLLNPGVKIAIPGERPLGDVKYDPTLSPLPVRARLALDAVSDDRSYAESRLALLDREPTARRVVAPDSSARQTKSI